MNLKIKLAYFSIILSIISFTGVFYGIDTEMFIVFAASCLAYSCMALYLFRKDGIEGSSKAFLGSLIAMIIVLVVHVFFIVITLALIVSDAWKWGFQFILTMFGIFPAMIIGSIFGKIIDLNNKKS